MIVVFGATMPVSNLGMLVQEQLVLVGVDPYGSWRVRFGVNLDRPSGRDLEQCYGDERTQKG